MYFLEKIAYHLSECYGEDLKNQCLVFPNRRAGLYFLKYLAAAKGKPVWSPGISTINELFSSGSELRIAESETLVLDLYSVYRKINKNAESFDEFYFWGEMLVNDFDDIDKYLADHARLFENLADIRRIDERFGELTAEQVSAIKQFWVSFNEGTLTREKNDFIKIWEMLPDLYDNFRLLLRHKGLAYEGMIFRDIAEGCIKGNLPVTKYRTFHFIGFNALNKCEKILLGSLKKAGMAKFYWDFDNSYISASSTHSAGYFLRNNIKEFGNDMPAGWNYETYVSVPGDNCLSVIIETSSDISQAKLLPQLLKETESVNGDEAHHTAVVLADESLLLPVLSAIPDEIKDVNVTMGFPLRFSPVYSFVHHLLTLQKNLRNENGEVLFRNSDIVAILRHGFLSDSDQAGNIEVLSEITENKITWIPETTLKKSIPYSLIFKKAASPADLSSYVKSVLEYFFTCNPEDEEAVSKSASESDIRNEFIYRTILSINRLDSALMASETVLSPATWNKLLDRILRKVTVPFSGEPLKGMQVMGILETRTLDFRNIILLSANEGILPRSSAGSSYIPYNLREAYGLPGIRHQDSIYAYYFYRLLHRAENTTFIYNSNPEGLKTGEMSRLLIQLCHLGKLKPVLSSTGCTINTPLQHEKIVKRKKEHSDLLAAVYLVKGGKALSPSAINTWLTCRMKFYFRYICGLKEPPKPAEELDPAQFGSFLHKIMHAIYEPFCGKPSADAVFSDLHSNPLKLKEIIDTVISREYYYGQERADDGNIMIIKSILQSYVSYILRYDKSIAPLVIEGLEHEIYAPVTFSTGDREYSVTCGGIIDRLDSKSGQYRIVDYKTGSIDMDIPSVESLFTNDGGERSDAWFQVLMYCELFASRFPGKRIRPSIYSLRQLPGKKFTDKLKIGTEKEGKEEIADYSSIREQYLAGLKVTLGSIFSAESDFEMTDNKRKCEFCPYRQLCSR